MSHHLIDIVQRLGHPHILVVGDLILDRYIWGDAERISQEAPVILLREDRREARLGGAANVANMLRGLEVQVCMAGVIGADEDAVLVRHELTRSGVDCSAVVDDPSRPTTVKQRYIGLAQHRHPHQMLRVDRESKQPLDAATEQRLLEAVLPRIAQFQAVLISDYAKGVCTPAVLQAVISAARQHGIPVIVDPAATADYTHYRHATAITPNRLETGLATGRTIRTREEAFTAGRELCARLDLEYIFVTLDSDGIALVRADGSAELLATRKREVYDITGAGDMVLATIGTGAAEGIAPDDLARLANVAGGLEVEQIGVVNITRSQIVADLLHSARGTGKKVYELESVARQLEARRKLGQTIVLTNGCFDVLHIGHVTYLQQAAREGDCLVVAINSDASVRSLGKAPDRPIFSEQERAAMLAALDVVDFVLVFEESTPHRVLETIQPDVLVKGGTYRPEEVVGREVVESYGGTVKVLGEVPGVSTTNILARLRGAPTEPPQLLPYPSIERKAG